MWNNFIYAGKYICYRYIKINLDNLTVFIPDIFNLENALK